jgi:hypothetical protein
MHLGAAAEVAPPAIDRTTFGERVTRFYAQNGQRFVVVLQPLSGDRTFEWRRSIFQRPLNFAEARQRS